MFESILYRISTIFPYVLGTRNIHTYLASSSLPYWMVYCANTLHFDRYLQCLPNTQGEYQQIHTDKHNHDSIHTPNQVLLSHGKYHRNIKNYITKISFPLKIFNKSRLETTSDKKVLLKMGFRALRNRWK